MNFKIETQQQNSYTSWFILFTVAYTRVLMYTHIRKNALIFFCQIELQEHDNKFS